MVIAKLSFHINVCEKTDHVFSLFVFAVSNHSYRRKLLLTSAV